MKPRARPGVRVQIDLNSRDREGNVRTRLANAGGSVRAGDQVVAYEPDDQVAASARVVRVDEGAGYLYLDVDWDTLDDDYVLSAPTQNQATKSRTIFAKLSQETIVQRPARGFGSRLGSIRKSTTTKRRSSGTERKIATYASAVLRRATNKTGTLVQRTSAVIKEPGLKAVTGTSSIIPHILRK